MGRIVEVIGPVISLAFAVVSLYTIYRMLTATGRRATSFGIGKASQRVPIRSAHRATIDYWLKRASWLVAGMAVAVLVFMNGMAVSVAVTIPGEIALPIAMSLFGGVIPAALVYLMRMKVLEYRADLASDWVVRTTGPIGVTRWTNMWQVETADATFQVTDTAGIALEGARSGTVEYSEHGRLLVEAWDDEGRQLYRDGKFFPESERRPGPTA